jgi:hypothetical protein
MPKLSKETAPRVEDAGVMVGHYTKLDGYTVGFEHFREDADATPLFKVSPTIAARARTGVTSSAAGSGSATPTGKRCTKPATPTTPPRDTSQ